MPGAHFRFIFGALPDFNGTSGAELSIARVTVL
jgi:hypothetical protein